MNFLLDTLPNLPADPERWAAAFKSLGFGAIGLVALYIICRYPPWRGAKKKQEPGE